MDTYRDHTAAGIAAGQDPLGASFGLQSVVGRSPAIREAIRLARKVAARPGTTVLLTGETGTGKELFARGIHYAGATAGEPFVAVNCAAIPETLLESELFGHEAGVFPGGVQKQGLLEIAGRGTLLLDEISELPVVLQPKLLRALEEQRMRRLGGVREVRIHCRIIAATNRPLEDAVARGEFREDLFYRLNVFRLNLPRLNQRADDVELLARHFLAHMARETGQAVKRLAPDALSALRVHSWPGNVRELKNVVERAALLCEERVIHAEHLMIQRRTARTAASAEEEEEQRAEIHIPASGKPLTEIEREAIYLTLRLTGGNQSAAARLLDISRPTLARKIQRYGVTVPGKEGAD